MKTNNTNKSIIEKLGEEHLREVVAKSNSVSDVLRAYSLCESGSASRVALRNIASMWGIALDFPNRYQSNVRAAIRYTQKNEILVQSGSTSRGAVKDFVIRHSLLDNTVCSICGISNTWNGKEITMILDHINGVSNDNRLENLRFVCPNCNSQLSTTGSRNIKGKYKYQSRRQYASYNKNNGICTRCKKEISGTGKTGLCVDCYAIKNRKVERPDLDVLLRETKELGFSATGRKYGVSDNAIRKWMGIKK